MRDSCEKSLRAQPNTRLKTGGIFAHVRAFLRLFLSDPRHEIPDVSDRLARDIGLSQHHLAVRRFQLPSQHSHHPRG